jgi:hypothetical protein
MASLKNIARILEGGKVSGHDFAYKVSAGSRSMVANLIWANPKKNERDKQSLSRKARNGFVICSEELGYEIPQSDAFSTYSEFVGALDMPRDILRHPRDHVSTICTIVRNDVSRA